jgi:hypothetical protein
MPTDKDERAKRLAEALRANLRKRKEGQRQEQHDPPPPSSASPPEHGE